MMDIKNVTVFNPEKRIVKDKFDNIIYPGDIVCWATTRRYCAVLAVAVVQENKYGGYQYRIIQGSEVFEIGSLHPVWNNVVVLRGKNELVSNS